MNETGTATIAAVIFDAVGTLIEPRPSVAAAYAAAASRQGITLEEAEVRRRFYRAFGAIESDDMRGPLATDEPAERRRWSRIVREVLPELPDPDRGFDELWDHFGRAEHWRAFPDAAPVLRQLADSGLRIRIASNFDGRLRPIIRGLPELAPWAEDLVISSEVGWRKPHPSFYEAALASLGLPAGCVLSVGDDETNDLEGARDAGLHALLLDRRTEPPGALATIGGLDAIPRWLACFPPR